MSKRDIGQEILSGIRDVKAYKAGTKVLRVHTLKEPAPPQIIRSKFDLETGKADFFQVKIVVDETIARTDKENFP